MHPPRPSRAGLRTLAGSIKRHVFQNKTQQALTVELGGRISSGGSSKGHGEIRGPHCIVKDTRPPGTVVVKGFVHNVPGIAFALVMPHLTGNMGLDGGRERAICPGA